ncbi:hypothetical protein G9A89_018984 [Geosiphon pyriformis]|nr:hypothetical protein G9A89_018984 [Geosiphon pyriformis]
MEFVRYFSNNKSINKLANLFTTIKQGDTEAITIYLERFHRNLCQIQAIQADYFTVPQILNQFIRGATQNPNSQNYLSLLVTPENATPNNQELKQILISNIPPATIMKDKSLDVIFSFKLEKPSTMSLFSGTTLEEKPITAMYTDVKIDGHPIKLILDSGSAGSIIT